MTVIRFALIAATLALGLGVQAMHPVAAAPRDGRSPLYRIEVKESFVCNDPAFCDAIFEAPSKNHENAVLYSDGTGHDELVVTCKAEIPGFCRAHATVHISEDFGWFIAGASCDDSGCVPDDGSCVPSDTHGCTGPVFWRDTPDVMRVIGCGELDAGMLSCARRGSSSVVLQDWIGSYPDNTFWPAVPGHYTFDSPEQLGMDPCDAFAVRHCPPPGISIQVQVTAY
jgi:hypothetical protein